jgi:hypothetical protein
MSLTNNDKGNIIECTTASISSTVTEKVQDASVPTLLPDEAAAKKTEVTDPAYRKYTLDSST